jgi:hypothetical protein
VALAGEMEVTVGFGLLIVNVSEFDGPPPGPGFVTITATVPALARSVAGILAVTLTLLTKVVTRAELFQRTVAPGTQFEVFKVSVKPAEPTVLLEGESDVSTIRGHCLYVDRPIRSARAIDYRRRGDAKLRRHLATHRNIRRRLARPQHRYLPQHGAVISVTSINTIVLCRNIEHVAHALSRT